MELTLENRVTLGVRGTGDTTKGLSWFGVLSVMVPTAFASFWGVLVWLSICMFWRAWMCIFRRRGCQGTRSTAMRERLYLAIRHLVAELKCV